MSAVRRLFALEMRSGGWRFVIVVALVLGIGGGAALAALAGARRTASAFDRLERYTRAADVLVAPSNLAELPVEKVKALPGIADVSTAYGLLVLTPEGEFIEAPILAVDDDHLGRTIERPKVLHGRLPERGRADEIFANPDGAAALGAKVGDQVRLIVVPADVDQSLLSLDDADLAGMLASGAFGSPHTFTLVGIGVTEADVVPGATLPSVLIPPEFSREHPPLRLYAGMFVRLHGGDAAVDGFSSDVRAVGAPGAAIDFQTTGADRSTVDRSLHPQVVALEIFGLVVAVGVLAAVGQALGRRTQLGLRRDATLGALGMTSPERRLVDALRAASVAILGALVAVLVAVALSTFVPFGSARLVEPHPGISVDPVVLVPGVLILCAGAFGAGVLAANRAAARRHPGASRLWAAINRLHGPPAAVTGVRFALDPGPSTSSVPTRSTLLTAAVGLAAIVASFTFAASLDHFVETPRVYGWSFDYLVNENSESPGAETQAFAALPGALDAAPDVRGWSLAYVEQGSIAGRIVPLVGVGAGGGAATGPTIVAGRAPARPDEVALGAATMRASRASLGDHLPIGSAGASFEVVGTVVLPGLRTHEASDQAALGSGALLTLDGLSKATGVGAEGAAAEPIGALVSVDTPGTETMARLQTHLDGVKGPWRYNVSGPQQPTDVVSYAKVRVVPSLLAAVLALLAAVTVGHALIVAIRQRRVDLAILRALGFTGRQVGTTLAWQATTVALLAAVVGIPLGLLAGRAAWSAVAHQLGIVDIVVLPVVAVLLAVPVALLLFNAVAVVPARRASALRPADALRAE